MKRLITLILLLLSTPALADNAAQSPFDLLGTLSSSPAPGTTITIPAGDYQPVSGQGVPNYPWVIKWQGAAAAPITLKASGHVVIHGGIQLLPPATHVILQGLEVTDAVNDGISLESGDGCKVVDCTVHGCATSGTGSGMGVWESTTNTEISGCVVWGNGTGAVATGGHGIYVQNLASTGAKLISQCIFYPAASADHYELHCYGEGGHTEAVTALRDVFVQGTALFGGKSLPAKGIMVSGCDFYQSDLNLGFTAPYSQDCTVTGNLIDGGLVSVNRFLVVTMSGNDLRTASVGITAPNAPAGSQQSYSIAPEQAVGFNWYGFPDGWAPPAAPLWPGQVWTQIRPGYVWTDTWYRGTGGYPPRGLTVHLWTDPYDATRAVLSVLNRDNAPSVSVDLSSFLRAGDHYRVLDPRQQWGSPVAEGDAGGSVTLPAGTATTGRPDLGSYAAYVVTRTPAVSPVTLDSLAQEYAALKDLLDRVAAKVGVQ